MSFATDRRLVVLRHGELFLKGANRGRFEKLLRDNVARALSGLEGVELERGQGRLFVDCPEDQVDRAVARLSRVFGVSSLSPAWSVEPELELLAERAVELVRIQIQKRQVRTFRVTARRSDKSYPVPSMELNRELGARVVRATGLGVDLHNPELVLGLEIGPRRCFMHVERLQGAGGLPVGASGKVALLLSGGIDSPVAGHLLQKRGCTLAAVYFHSFPYTGERTRDKVARLAALLAPAQGGLNLLVAHFTEIQQRIRDGAPAEMAVVLYRRSMLRIATRLALQQGCGALASGENLGQVASQTLENLACIQLAAGLPVLRPLLTYDKAETIALARRIGTYELSIQPYEDCCSLFVPRHPLTRARATDVERAESKLSLEPLEAQAAEGVDLLEIG